MNTASDKTVSAAKPAKKGKLPPKDKDRLPRREKKALKTKAARKAVQA
jgi:hypothetical protein